MRGLRPSLGAAGSLLAAAAGLWLLASALLGFHAWPGGPGPPRRREIAPAPPPSPDVAPPSPAPPSPQATPSSPAAAATPPAATPGPVSRVVTLVRDTAAPVATAAPAPVQTVVATVEDAAQDAAQTVDGLLGGG